MENFDIGKMMELFGNFNQLLDTFTRKLSSKTVESSVGGGMVKLTMNGLGKVVRLEIDEELIKMNDKSMMEDMLSAAINLAMEELKKLFQQSLTEIMEENLPLINMIKDMLGGNEE